MDRRNIKKLRSFLENEARSCSMDFGCITPLYVYRMWGGAVPLNEIEEALRVLGQAKRQEVERMMHGSWLKVRYEDN